MKKYPKWFWLSLIGFMVFSWGSIPLASILSIHARYVAQTILYSGAVFYPIFSVVVLVLLFVKTKLDADEKIWAFLIILVPLFTYLPFWYILSMVPF